MNPIRDLLLAGSRSRWLRDQASRRRIVRRAVSRFMPGETLEEAMAAARTLAEQRLGVILTHLGENVSDRAEAAAVVDHYLHVLERLAASGLDAEVSVKLTQLGLDLGRELAYDHCARVLEAAERSGRRVWIDMEATPYTDATLDLFRRLRARHAGVGVCLQAYLRRTRDDLERLLPVGPAIRLVKGAYREPAHLAWPRKRDVDENFLALAARLLSPEARRAGARLVVGTHDVRLITRIQADLEANAIPSGDVEFALLYGIQRGEQLRLAQAGRPTRVLISYGAYWFPWYMRRLAERPANLWFVLRNAFGG